MPRPRKPKPTLPPPLDSGSRLSLDPIDWRMYCDRLQDAGAPEGEWQRAGRIAESLAADVKLVLINYCPPQHLERHWLRVGGAWFIGAERTIIEGNKLAWWRPDWVREGFARYPTTDPKRDEEKLIALNHGTPWDCPHPRFGDLRQKKRAIARCLASFFETHATVALPQEYL